MGSYCDILNSMECILNFHFHYTFDELVLVYYNKDFRLYSCGLPISILVYEVNLIPVNLVQSEIVIDLLTSNYDVSCTDIYYKSYFDKSFFRRFLMTFPALFDIAGIVFEIKKGEPNGMN